MDEFCQANKISPLNTRLVKLGDNKYEMRIASAKEDKEKTPYMTSYDFKTSDGISITVTVRAGDFAPIMERVVENMQEAFNYVANENQSNMIKDYIEHFKFGE